MYMYICCSCNRGCTIWSLQRGRSPLGELVVLLYVFTCLGIKSSWLVFCNLKAVILFAAALLMHYISRHSMFHCKIGLVNTSTLLSF